MRSFSASGPVIWQPVASLIAALPPVWSGCQWVFQIWVMVQPRFSASASTGSATAGSTTMVSCDSVSWTSQT